jgi:hypothetical protein
MEECMLGTTFVLPDVTAFSGVSELPDVASHILTLQQRNQDNFGSAYGFKGTDYDYQVLIRNSRESVKPGQAALTRHNVELSMIKRPTVSAGIVTGAIPYYCSITFRQPETGTVVLGQGVGVSILYALLGSNANKIPKLFNFES